MEDGKHDTYSKVFNNARVETKYSLGTSRGRHMQTFSLEKHGSKMISTSLPVLDSSNPY